MHPVDVGADLPQGDREQIQLLIADGLVGGHQHPPPLVELHQILLGFHLGLGDGGALLHPAQGPLVVGRHRGDGAVVHAVKPGDGGGDVGQEVGLLHALPHGAGDVLGEEDGGLAGGKELLHRVAARALHLDVKALELPLIGVQPLQRRALILLRGVLPLQHLGEGAARLVIHALFQSQVVKTISHISIPPFLTGG